MGREREASPLAGMHARVVSGHLFVFLLPTNIYAYYVTVIVLGVREVMTNRSYVFEVGCRQYTNQ